MSRSVYFIWHGHRLPIPAQNWWPKCTVHQKPIEVILWHSSLHWQVRICWKTKLFRKINNRNDSFVVFAYSFAELCNLTASIRLLFNCILRSIVDFSPATSLIFWNIDSKCKANALKNVPNVKNIDTIVTVIDRNTIPVIPSKPRRVQYPSNVAASKGVLFWSDNKLNLSK